MALLEVWKTFEENNGGPEDVKKVQDMMPIVTKKRHVDQETGQTVEGQYALFFSADCDKLMLGCYDVLQIGT